GDEEADKLLGRTYRAPYSLPTDKESTGERECVFHSRAAAGHEGRVRGPGRQPGKIERARYRCLPGRARQGWLARRWRPLDLSAITGRAATYRTARRVPRGQPAAVDCASRPRGEP